MSLIHSVGKSVPVSSCCCNTQRELLRNTYYLSVDRDLYNSGLLGISEALEPFCAKMLAGAKKKKMESTSFSTLYASELPPDDLSSLFFFCDYDRADFR